MKSLIYPSILLLACCCLGLPDSAAAQASPDRGGALPYNSVYSSEVRDRTVARVQAALTRRGYYVGLTTGEFPSETRITIRRYQREHGLRESGKIDAALLRSLGVQ